MRSPNADRLTVAALVALSAMFVLQAAANLENYRPVASDEIWIISVSHKLATDGVLGTDLTRGLFDIDQHYFVNPPGQNLLHLPAFWLFGTGVAQARLMSVLSAIALVWAVATLGWRWYGREVAALAVLVLFFWRSSLIALELGVPLLSVARSARHDVSAVTWMWLAILGTDTLLRKPSRWVGFATGLSCAAASLTQFYGPFIVPTVLGMLLWRAGPRVLRTPAVRWVAVGCFLPVVPYVLYIGTHWSDAVLQFTYTFGDRMNYTDPGFLLANPISEIDRFTRVASVLGFGNWLLLVGGPPAVGFLCYRAIRLRRPADRMLLLSLAIPAVLLAFVDTTKAPIYALVLLPALCLLAAVSIARLFHRRTSNARGHWGQLISGGIMLLLLSEGLAVYWRDRQNSRAVSAYHDVSRQIAGALAPGQTVAGAERWWWGLREREYISLNSLFMRWRVQHDRGTILPSLPAIVDGIGVQAIIVSSNVQLDIIRYPVELQRQFSSFLRDCTQQAAEWDDRTYRHISVYHVAEQCPDRR